MADHIPCTRYTCDALAALIGSRLRMPETGMDDAFAQEIISHIIRLDNENEDLRRRNRDHVSAAERHRNVIKMLEQDIAALEKLPQWRTDAPPRDRVFLAKLGWPWPVMCHYSPLDNDFVWAMVQVNVVDGEWNDYYFETEHSPEKEITGWMEVPK